MLVESDVPHRVEVLMLEPQTVMDKNSLEYSIIESRH